MIGHRNHQFWDIYSDTAELGSFEHDNQRETLPADAGVAQDFSICISSISSL